MFVGRKNELQELERRYKLNSAQLAVVYGRRRVGKSELLKLFCKDKSSLKFEGLESQPQQIQIQNVLNLLSIQMKDPFIAKLGLKRWNEVFDLITNCIDKIDGKLVLVFDEFQWMANLRSPLVSLLKMYWDIHWKNKNLMLVLCGSVATFMVDRVIRSKALYGRINFELCLQGLMPEEARQVIGRRGEIEVLKYLMIFGTIPKYLEEIDQTKSFDANLNSLCFTRNGFFTQEIDKVFYSQFRESQTYKQIVETLATGNYTLTELSKKLKISSGGGLKSYLKNLELSGFIRSYNSIQHKGTRNQKYKIFDEFLVFYFKYIHPHRRQISENEKQQLFNLLVNPNWDSWLGIAFENFCLKHAMALADRAGFANEVISFAPYFGSKDKKFQIDMLFSRAHNILTVCEVKFYTKPVGTEIIPEMERKLILLGKKEGQTIERMLIAPFGADRHLLSSKYFHHVLDLKDIFKI